MPRGPPLADPDRSPAVATIAYHTSLSEREVLAGMEALKSFRPLSLDAPTGHPGSAEGFSLADTLGQGGISQTHVSRLLSGICARPRRRIESPVGLSTATP